MYALVVRYLFSQYENEKGEKSSKFLGAKMLRRAASAFGAGKPLPVMEVNREGTCAGNVLVEIAFHLYAPTRTLCGHAWRTAKSPAIVRGVSRS